MHGERGNGSASMGSNVSKRCSQHACPAGKEGFSPLLLGLLNPLAPAPSSRLQTEDWSLEISWYPSVSPRSLLPNADLPGPPRRRDEPGMAGREMQERHQQPERDIKPHQSTFCTSASPPGL